MLALGAMGVAQGCRAPTQVTLRILSPEVVCAALKGVRITVAANREEAERRTSDDFISATATPCRDPQSHELGTLVVTPGSARTAAIVVVAGIRNEAASCKAGNRYEGCVVARRSLSFVDNASLEVPVTIEPSCADVPCDVATTCKSGTCIGADLDCSEDGCVSRDPRGEADGGAGDGGGAHDGGDLGDAAADGATDGGGVDAKADGPDGAVPALCPGQCSSGGGGAIFACPGSTKCCERAGGPGGGPTLSLTCAEPSDCQAPSTGRAGIVLCCRTSAECGAGQVCCYERSPSNHVEPHGLASCVATAQCVGADKVALCGGGGNVDCTSVGKVACMSWTPGGYATDLVACQ